MHKRTRCCKLCDEQQIEIIRLYYDIMKKLNNVMFALPSQINKPQHHGVETIISPPLDKLYYHGYNTKQPQCGRCTGNASPCRNALVSCSSAKSAGSKYKRWTERLVACVATDIIIFCVC